MSAVDDKVDLLADRLQQFAKRSASEGGVKAKLAQPLAEDAAFLRKLKPSLVKARVRGEAPPTDRQQAPAAPQVTDRPRPKPPPRGRGPNPWLVVGACFVTGIAVAKWIDWRGHAHPRA
jgi:hypothetical protein